MRVLGPEVDGVAHAMIEALLVNQYDTGFTEVAWFLCQCAGTRNDYAFHHNQHCIGHAAQDNCQG